MALDSDERKRIDERLNQAEKELKDLQTRVRSSLERFFDKDDATRERMDVVAESWEPDEDCEDIIFLSSGGSNYAPLLGR